MRIRPTLPFFAFLLDSASAARSFPNLRCIHTLLIITGLSSSDFLRSKLCSAYAACGHLPEASHIFSRANRRPTFLYNSLLRSLADLHRYTSALLLFQTMLSDTAAPDHRTLSAVLRSCAGIPSPGHGCSVHALAAAVGLADHLAVSNSLISMYSKCGDLETAREVFDRMPERDLVTWTAMIGGCGDHGVPMEDLVEGMLACCGGRLDGEAMTVVLAACVRNGLTELGVSVFDAMMEGRFGEVRPSVEHYTCMVELLGRAGRVEEVENLVISMQAEPDEALCRALLVLRAGLAERGHCSVS